MIIVPIGVDCGIAGICEKNNLRIFSLRFDWIVTYNGVSKCIKDDFKSFIPEINKTLNDYALNDYNMSFVHDFKKNNFNEDKIKYDRRIKRFVNILETTNETVIFCRKSHTFHHHSENENIINDIEDVEKLNIIIKNKYPNLNYKIILFLSCGICFDKNKTYKSNSNRIEIHNIATLEVNNIFFEKTFLTILQK